MKLPSATPLNVRLSFGPGDIAVGRLAFDRQRGAAALEYDGRFLEQGLRLNPLWPAPNRTLVWAAEPRTFSGLHGVFADSLPDTWGRELVRRRAIAAGIDPSSLTAVDQLAIVGHRGMGALSYEPDFNDPEQAGAIDLDALARAALDVLADREPSALLPTLEELGASSGGARPKLLIALDDAGAIRSGVDALPPGFRAYLVKFPSSRDRSDIGPVEAAYADMARAAGLDVAPTTLLPSRTGGPGYFATQRFDRGEDGARTHVLSAAGMLETRWDVPTFDYSTLLGVTRVVTRDQRAVELAFRRMVFNVVAHNRDDHAKQHAFLCGNDGAWHLAPAYDLTFSSGPNGEHYLAVNGRGSDVSLDDIRAVGKQRDVSPAAVARIVDEVRAAVSRFEEFAATYGVGKRSRSEIATVLQRLVAAVGRA
jgi:serine/threonine-protein kinase HipA